MENDPRTKLFEDLPFMAHARKESLKSTYKHKMGVVIANKRAILGTGYNKLRYKRFGNRFMLWDESLHAEVDAITQISRHKLVGSTIYIYRETKDGVPSLAFPCGYCFNAIEWARIKRVYYTTDDPNENYWRCIRL
jgi:deoxycytidylate deaminase